MKQTIPLPKELWILVLDSLDFSDLKIASLTCRTLRSLAVSRLFRRLVIGMPVRGSGVDGWGLWKFKPFGSYSVKPKTLSATNELLAFYGSNYIAPVVREFWLVGYADNAPLQPDIGAILALVHRFSNVRSVGFTSSQVTPRIMQTIARLPALTSISMDGCLCYRSEPPLLRLKDVTLIGSDLEGNWPFTIQPELLESLHVDAIAFPNLSSLPNLRTFRVYRDSTAPIIRCLEFLARCHCPSLDTLLFHRAYLVDGELATFDTSTLPMIPRLKIYHGPSCFVPLFAAGGLLRRASLWSSPPTRPMADDLDTLHALAPKLTSLTVYVLSPLTVACAVHRFRDLEELYVTTRNIGPDMIQDFLAVLDSEPLPPNLCRVEIRSRIWVGSRHLSQQDIVTSMRTNLPLPHVSVRPTTSGDVMHVYTWLTRDAIDDVTVDPQNTSGLDDSDTESDTSDL